ncbi:MAG: ATP-dependent Clp protease ATP-binding subunit [Alphaproteobacteria bacterium]|nr:ATP-dependent Clp protease ATP-binding subunit [Alphaproteobacteria bacterium]
MTVTPNYVISDAELDGLLSRYTRDITAQQRAGRFDPITGRDEELDHMVLILLQRLRKNVMLLGGAGVGKTALFIGLAQLIEQDKVPALLRGARVIELEMSMIGAGSQSRADLEGRLIPIIKGVAERNAARDAGTGKTPPIIFCIDEIHQLMLGFKASSYAGIADLMKPYLTAGDLFVIGATTREEYEDYVTIEPAIDRRFQKIFLSTPDVAMTLTILMNLKGNFEKHYGIEISRESCAHVVRMTDRYIRNRNNPDKSILALDHACARFIKGGGEGALDRLSIEAAVASEAGIDAAAVK